jgi:hypothetical protein
MARVSGSGRESCAVAANSRVTVVEVEEVLATTVAAARLREESGEIRCPDRIHVDLEGGQVDRMSWALVRETIVRPEDEGPGFDSDHQPGLDPSGTRAQRGCALISARLRQPYLGQPRAGHPTQRYAIPDQGHVEKAHESSVGHRPRISADILPAQHKVYRHSTRWPETRLTQ